MNKRFYEEIAKEKNIIRRGWILRNLPNRLESDAEHTFSMIMLALNLFAKNKLNLDEMKVIKMIAYHELCEIDVGDITPLDNITREEKFNKEHRCIKRLSKELNIAEIEEIWLEFEENKTKESQFVKNLDKFDAIMQANEYANQYKIPELYEEFKNRSKKEFDYINKYKID